MGVEEFLEIFVRELEINKDLHGYYRLLSNDKRYYWRKAYVEQRLAYVYTQLQSFSSSRVWDAGCGYGTTAIFLALNGYTVMGNTLEFYYEKISNRLDFWSRYGDLSALRIEYANLFDMTPSPGSFDAIIAQDTLHHLEPINEAVVIFNDALRKGGKVIVTEENGNSLFIRLKNFSKRGFKNVTEYYDDQLQKKILFGNENARSMKTWRNILEANGFAVPENETGYIRFYPPFCFNNSNYGNRLEQERTIAEYSSILRELLYFGINFTAVKE